jgi:hypothetical protein
MKTKFSILSLALLLAVANGNSADSTVTPKESILESRPLGVQLSVKMIGPFTEAADLQIICLLKHKASGDTYEGAAKETDSLLGGLLSSLRNRGEFVGELGETILFTPPKGSIPARRFMVIGLGDEKDLSLNSLRVVGRIAAREAVRLQAKHIAWAPVIRDEGVSTMRVGETDRVFIEELLSAYDTEKRLQAQGLAPEFSIETFTLEAGPAFFDDAVKGVQEGIKSAMATLGQRNAEPYRSVQTK